MTRRDDQSLVRLRTARGPKRKRLHLRACAASPTDAASSNEGALRRAPVFLFSPRLRTTKLPFVLTTMNGAAFASANTCPLPNTSATLNRPRSRPNAENPLVRRRPRQPVCERDSPHVGPRDARPEHPAAHGEALFTHRHDQRPGLGDEHAGHADEDEQDEEEWGERRHGYGGTSRIKLEHCGDQIGRRHRAS